MVCQQTQYTAFRRLIRHTPRRRNYAVVHDPIQRSSSVTFCYKGRKFAFADTHHYAQAEISKTPLTQFTLGIRGSKYRGWHSCLVLLGRCAHGSKRNLPHTAGLGNALQYRLYLYLWSKWSGVFGIGTVFSGELLSIMLIAFEDEGEFVRLDV